MLELTSKVQSEVNTELSKTQREYYLREQLKAIQKELGESDDRGEELEELRKSIDAQIAPRTVSSVHCAVTDPTATCTFIVSGTTYRQHFSRSDHTWTPSDAPAAVAR